MRICFLSYDYPSPLGSGGVGNQTKILASFLIREGHEVSVIDSYRPGFPEECEEDGVKIYRVKTGNLHWYVYRLPVIGGLFSRAVLELEQSWGAYRLIKKLNNRKPFDLIETSESRSFWVAILLKKIPMAVRLHGEEYTFFKYTPSVGLTAGTRLARLLQRAAMRRARILISPSLAHGEEIQKEFRRDSPVIKVIPNTIETTPSLKKREENDRIVLFAGRLEKCKAVPEILRAFKGVLAECPGARLILAGGPHPTLSKKEIDRIVEENSLGASVEFAGHISSEKLSGLYSRAAVCVLPSYYETFGVTALEAMAHGIPVVATTAGALPEVVEHERTGLLVPPGDVPALSGAIVRLLKDSRLRAALGEEGRRAAEEKFSASKICPLNLRTYQSILGFENKKTEKHFFFSAHSDDAVFSCGGRIAALADAGAEVSVTTVFCGDSKSGEYSAYALHFHSKWGGGGNAAALRRGENRAALEALKVKAHEEWEFPEAVYRAEDPKRFLYACSEEIFGSVHGRDSEMENEIAARARAKAGSYKSEAVLYFPLSLGGHVDHSILFNVGKKLQGENFRVKFYEDWPYVEEYLPKIISAGVMIEAPRADLERKMEAIMQYKTQIKDLSGGTREGIEKKMKSFASKTGAAFFAERFWSFESAPEIPFEKRPEYMSVGSFRKFLSTFKWHDLGEVLPAGSGVCLDLGCGGGRHAAMVRGKGFEWLGADLKIPVENRGIVVADAGHLPFGGGTMSGVVAWQVFEYLKEPDKAVAEIGRVLKRGGVFCGSISFLEPVNGKTPLNFGPEAVRYLLKKNGFKDIRVLPGLNGFALGIWTFFMRIGGKSFAACAVPLAAIFVVPLGAVRFFTSWFWKALGRGDGDGMRWITKVAPLEFAGQLIFSARKAE